MKTSARILLIGVLVSMLSIPRAGSSADAPDMTAVRRDIAHHLSTADLEGRTMAAAPIAVRGLGINIFKDRSPGVVVVRGQRGLGTGVIINRFGDIVTNEHVVRTAIRSGGSEWVAINFKPGQGATFDPDRFLEARVMRRSIQHDLAVVRLQQPLPEGATIIPLASGRPIVGSDVFVIGHPQELFWSLTQGIVSQIRPEFDFSSETSRRIATVIQTQAFVNPGNSGGPLLDARGEVVGIVSFSRAQSQGLFFAVDVQHVRDLLARPGDD